MTGVAGGKEFREDAGTVGALSKDDSAIITSPRLRAGQAPFAVPAGWDSGPSNTLKHPSLVEESGQERGGLGVLVFAFWVFFRFVDIVFDFFF